MLIGWYAIIARGAGNHFGSPRSPASPTATAQAAYVGYAQKRGESLLLALTASLSVIW